MLKNRNGRNKRRREGQSLIMSPKLRKVGYFTIRSLAAEDLLTSIQAEKAYRLWLGRAQIVPLG